MVAEQERKAGYLKLQEQASEEMKAKSYVEIDDERIRRKAGPQAAIEQIWKEVRGILQPETESSSSSNDDGSDCTSDEEEDSDEISYSNYSSDEEDDSDDSEYSSDEEEDDIDDDDDDGSSDDYSSDEEEDDYDNVGDYWADDEDSNYSTSDDDEEDCFMILGDCAMFGFNMVTAMSRAVSTRFNFRFVLATAIRLCSSCFPSCVECMDR